MVEGGGAEISTVRTLQQCCSNQINAGQWRQAAPHQQDTSAVLGASWGEGGCVGSHKDQYGPSQG